MESSRRVIMSTNYINEFHAARQTFLIGLAMVIQNYTHPPHHHHVSNDVDDYDAVSVDANSAAAAVAVEMEVGHPSVRAMAAVIGVVAAAAAECNSYEERMSSLDVAVNELIDFVTWLLALLLRLK
uniref:Pyridoxine 5'-phosphate synthase n=1 Tax=Lygus hesperus TaxID=30085 RepID=A0A0A9YXC7_LYGHE